MSRVLALCAVVALGIPAIARADLDFDQAQVDKGSVLTGTRLVHTFAFSNSSRVPITIQSLRSSCGCLTSRADRNTVLPGEKGEIVMEVNTLSQPEGPNGWRIQVEYKEGEALWERTLELRATLQTEIEVSPASLTIYTDGSLGSLVTVKDRRPNSTLQISDCRTSSPHVLARANPPANGTQTVSLSLAPSHPSGRHNSMLSIFTSDPNYPELRVPVTIVKRPKQGVLCSPSSVALVTTAQQSAASRLVLVRGNDDSAVILQGATADHPALNCRFASGPGNMATVKVEVDATQVKEASLRSTVTIQVSMPTPQTITVPVTWTRQ